MSSRSGERGEVRLSLQSVPAQNDVQVLEVREQNYVVLVVLVVLLQNAAVRCSSPAVRVQLRPQICHYDYIIF